MKPRTHKQESLVIVYDAEQIQHPDPQLFDPDYWRKRNAISGEAQGRGSALFLDTPYGQLVLRRYLRGGWPAKVSRDRYLFNGWERSRPLDEFRILTDLATHNLPVPDPIAAMTQRNGPFYTGHLLTRRLPNAEPLADAMLERANSDQPWQNAGACIRRFHDFGLVHADLNARNILVDGEDNVFLIDFDRARISRGDSRACRSNLERLRRSFDKLWPPAVEGRLEECWQLLMAGYDQTGEGE